MPFTVPQNIPDKIVRPTMPVPPIQLTWEEWTQIQADQAQGVCVHRISRYHQIADGLVGLTTIKPAPQMRVPKHFSERLSDVAPPAPKPLMVASALIAKGELVANSYDATRDAEAACAGPAFYWFEISIVEQVKEPKEPCLTIGANPQVWVKTPSMAELIQAAGVEPSPRKPVTMKAITIIQPFAELIARREKQVENRTWPTNYRGPLAIHAGKAQVYDGRPVEAIARGFDIHANTLIFGAVIATARLIDCIKIQDANRLPDKHYLGWVKHHQHAHGPYCWILGDIKPLQKPVYTRGAQGLWDWEKVSA